MYWVIMLIRNCVGFDLVEENNSLLTKSCIARAIEIIRNQAETVGAPFTLTRLSDKILYGN